jgi:hypothetical protein
MNRGVQNERANCTDSDLLWSVLLSLVCVLGRLCCHITLFFVCEVLNARCESVGC